MRFNILNNQIDKIPDEIAKFIRKLGKNLDQTLSHIENKNIPYTNNWLELFFNTIFPKSIGIDLKQYLELHAFYAHEK